MTCSEKKSSFDLLDAITRSGALPIETAEIHVLVCVAHCFEKDLMGTILYDNINPITKVEKSAVLLASSLHQVPPSRLIASPQSTKRLAITFPLLFEEIEDGMDDNNDE